MAHSSVRKRSYLIVDDDIAMRRALLEFLDLEENSVTAVDNGAAAIEQVKQARPDVVLLDIDMPGMNGIQCLLKMRAIRPDLLVIMMTATADPSVGAEAMRKGARDFLPKPIDFDVLAKFIRVHLFIASKSGS